LASREVVLKRSGDPAPIAAFPERAAESLAFDAAVSSEGTRAAIVWDEDEGAAKGGITLAVVPLGGGPPLGPRVVSGETADPDGPRLVPRVGGGWWVAWTAHRVEPVADAGARGGASTTGAIEAPAEDRAYSWVELAIVGDDGALMGSPRRISSPIGRVASFDLAPRLHGGGLDLVVRDETQLREGEGGRVLHVVVSADGAAEDPSVLVAAGAGRGSVDLITGTGEAAWLSFSDALDRTLVVPLGPSRLALGPPSLEDALEGGRLMTLTGQSTAAHFVAAFPGTDGALFREVACVP
jgi:hypothetical protein